MDARTSTLPLPHCLLDGPADGAPLILGPSLGTSLALWDPVLPALTDRHRVLRWDLPGHGSSPSSVLPSDGSATVGGLATQVLRLADAQGWDRFDWAGVSLGGAVGLHLAVYRPDRVRALALVCSSAWFGAADTWQQRAATVQQHGTGVLAASRPGTWFTAGFEHTPFGAQLMSDLATADAAGYAACCAALAGFDLRDRLGAVRAPTLVVAGRDDPATPPSHARELADGIADATLLELPHAAHLAGAERPKAVGTALHAHFTDGATGAQRGSCEA